jgi:uncharacterized protein YdeI (YjbR/CyaY-like superfamily)
MAAYDPRVDAYIEKSAAFAQPVLNHWRELLHAQCPDIVETIKWGFPNFEYHNRTLFNMAAFKQHCSFGFWLAQLLTDPKGVLQLAEKAAMGSIGRIESMKDLPPDTAMKNFIKQSMKLADDGVKVKKEVKKEPAIVEAPDYFMAELKKHKKALAVFEGFPPSHRKEYIEWITDAKREETRNKRITEAIEMIAEGKSRNWKYK